MTTTLDLLRCKRMPEPSLSPGVYFDLDARDYHRAAALSGTVLGEYIDSPLQCRAYLDSEDDEGTPDTDLGTIAHLLGLEPEDFWRYVQFGCPRWPETTKDGKPSARAGQPYGKASKEYAKWAEQVRADGKLPAHDDDRPFLEAVGKTLCTDEEIRQQLGRRGDDAASEVSIFWTNALGLPCKCRVDRVRFEGGLSRATDIKTTHAKTVRKFQSQCWALHYPMKAMHYLEGLAAAASFDERFAGEWDFSWIAITKTLRRVEAFVAGLDDEGWAIAKGQHQQAVASFGESFVEGVWPGLAFDGRVTLHAPDWLKAEPVEQEAWEADEDHAF